MDKNNKVIQFKRNFNKKTKTQKSSKRGFSLFNEGMCFYKLNKDELALKKFQAAENEGYESADMYAYMGWLYGFLDQLDKAQQYAQKAIDIDEEYGFAYCVMANSYYKQDNDQKTLEYNLLAEKHDYTEEIMLRQISMIYNQPEHKNFLKSLKYASKAIKFDPKNSYSYYWKGYIYFTNEDYKNALKYYKKAESLGYVDFSLYYEMSYCYSCLEDHQKGIEYANKSIFLDKDYQMGYYRKGFAYFQAGDDEHALEPFLQAEKLGCKEPDMYTRIAFLYGCKNQNTKAFEFADKAIKTDKKSPEGYIIKADIYSINFKDYKSAAKLLKTAYELYEGNADVNFYMNYITILHYLNRYKKALELTNEALEKFPQNYDLISIKISALQFTKQYEQAQIETEKLIKIDPNAQWTQYTKALTYYNCNYRKRDYDKVIALISPLDSEEIEKYGGKKGLLALCYCAKKDFEKSTQLFFEFAKEKYSNEFYIKNKKELQKLFKTLNKKRPDDTRLKTIKKLFEDI